MSSRPPSCPVDEVLVDYACGELSAAETDSLEDHLFECSGCAGRLDALDELRRSVASAVGAARVGVNANRAFLERAVRGGLTMREYRIPEGETVSCVAGPEDLVVVRLAAEWEGGVAVDLEVDFADLEHDRTAFLERRELSVDRGLGEVVLVFPGELVRGYPRSRWTMSLREETPEGPRLRGPFVMDHSP